MRLITLQHLPVEVMKYISVVLHVLRHATTNLNFAQRIVDLVVSVRKVTFVDRMQLEVPASNAKNVKKRNPNTNVARIKNFPHVVQLVHPSAMISPFLCRNRLDPARHSARSVVFANKASIVRARNVSLQKDAVLAKMNALPLVVLLARKHATPLLLSARNNVSLVVFALLRISFAETIALIVLAFLEKNALLKSIDWKGLIFYQ